jgi:hypothetical protein
MLTAGVILQRLIENVSTAVFPFFVEKTESDAYY